MLINLAIVIGTVVVARLLVLGILFIIGCLASWIYKGGSK